MEAGRKSGDWAVWNDEREKKEIKVSVRKIVLFRYKDAKFKVSMEVKHVTQSVSGERGGAEPTGMLEPRGKWWPVPSSKCLGWETKK